MEKEVEKDRERARIVKVLSLVRWSKSEEKSTAEMAVAERAMTEA